jgi:tetratricopeptide (TPR) repeat protein
VEPVDGPPGWQAIGEKLSQQIDHCQQLLNRKAYYSAREEAETAMLYLVRVLDLMSNSYRSEPAWHAAGLAMQEAEDFSNMQRLTSDSDFLRRIILSHQTPVLKDVDATELAPLTAAQHYRQYAEFKMTEAAQGHPWAAEVIYALGRTYQAQADAVSDETQHNLRWKAVTLYRGARHIAPSNAVAANQLGYVLLQMDRPLDAREAVVTSLNATPSLAAYENLVEASRRLGDTSTANWATAQAMVIRAAQPQHSPIPAVVEVDPRTFAAVSPYTIGPNPNPHASATQPYRAANASTSPNPIR